MLSRVLSAQIAILTFRDVRIDLKQDRYEFLVYVFVVSWLVGMGRYWDHPDAFLWQYLGLGSVAYIIVLSAFLYVVILPLRPVRWSYDFVLIFVGLTSLPGLLYAIPVERFFELDDARIANAWFLGVVALWRVAVYIRFLRVSARLGRFSTFIATLLPLSAIVVSLSLLNLEHVVFELMAGMREPEPSANDTAYTIVFVLSVLAYVAFPATLLCYVGAIYREYARRRSGRLT